MAPSDVAGRPATISSLADGVGLGRAHDRNLLPDRSGLSGDRQPALRPLVDQTTSNFYANAAGPGGVGIQDRYDAAWRHVTQRFSSNPAALGYDLLNEPWSGNIDTVRCDMANGDAVLETEWGAGRLGAPGAGRLGAVACQRPGKTRYDVSSDDVIHER